MGKPVSRAKKADSKGRITLGGSFANRWILVEQKDDVLILRVAKMVPEHEAWLYENPKAVDLLRTGLDQARKRKFGRAPDLRSARKLADRIPDA